MSKLIAALLALALPLLASASCTWTSIDQYSAKVVCTTGTEAAPTLVTAGVALNMVAFTLTAEADSGQTLSGAGTWQAYLWIESAGGWARAPDLDVTVGVTTLRRQAWAGFTVAGRRGRIAYAPSGVTVSSGGNTLYVQWAG